MLLKILKEYGGKLIEIPYTKGISSEAISSKNIKSGIQPEERINSLKRYLENKDLIRIIETHSPISALIAENSIEEINGSKIF